MTWQVRFNFNLGATAIMQKASLWGRPRWAPRISAGQEQQQLVPLTFQSQLFESSVSSRLQQLAHYPVGLLQVPLHHRHPPPVPGQDGRHSWAQDPGPNYHHIWLGGLRGAPGWGTLWGRGLYFDSFPCSLALEAMERRVWLHSLKTKLNWTARQTLGNMQFLCHQIIRLRSH